MKKIIDKRDVKPMFIFIEGVDRVGKGSLMQAIHKITSYKHVIFDRGILSNMAYSTIYNRMTGTVYKDYLKLERQIKKLDHLVIYMDCENEELERRCKDTNHEEVDYEQHKATFNSLYVTSVLNIHKVDSTNMSPDEIAQQLFEQKLI